MAIATMAIGEGSRSRVPALPLRVGPWMQDDILEHGGWVGWRACCVLLLAAAVRGGVRACGGGADWMCGSVTRMPARLMRVEKQRVAPTL